MPNTIINDLKEINRRTCQNIYQMVSLGQKPTGIAPRLILPNNGKDSMRLSEQEARFLFCSVLNNLSYYYSIETPTKEKYRFAEGEGTESSARSDVSLYSYENSEFKKIVNVEFKGHNPELLHIDKDIQKIFREEILGNWFHILKNADSSTLKVLLEEKLAVSCIKIAKVFKKPKAPIVFCFCIKNLNWACMKVFNYNESDDYDKYVNSFFKLDYKVAKGHIVTNNNSLNGWETINGFVD